LNTINSPAPFQSPVETPSQIYVQHTVKGDYASVSNNNRNSFAPSQSFVETPSQTHVQHTVKEDSTWNTKPSQPTTLTPKPSQKPTPISTSVTTHSFNTYIQTPSPIKPSPAKSKPWWKKILGI
jgi:hypothetical protein